MATTLVMGQEKSSDLVLSSLVRARFCELVAPRVEHGATDLFLMGMLSLMDAILAVPIGMVIEELSLAPDIKAQLLCAKTASGRPFRRFTTLWWRAKPATGNASRTWGNSSSCRCRLWRKRRMKPCAGRTKSPAPRAPLGAPESGRSRYPFDDTFAAGRAGLGAKARLSKIAEAAFSLRAQEISWLPAKRQSRLRARLRNSPTTKSRSRRRASVPATRKTRRASSAGTPETVVLRGGRARTGMRLRGEGLGCGCRSSIAASFVRRSICPVPTIHAG